MKRSLAIEEVADIVSSLNYKTFGRGVEKDEVKTTAILGMRDRLQTYLKSVSIYPSQIPLLKAKIIQAFDGAQIASNDPVGILTAMAFGEPVTQMTLNSLDWHEEILYTDNGQSVVKPIGQIIDSTIRENLTSAQFFENDTTYIDVKNKNWKIPSVNENGLMSWEKITAVTRHLPTNEDGTNTLLKVSTRTGRSVTATKAKSFLVLSEDGRVVPVNGSDLRLGQRIPITRYLEVEKMYNLPREPFAYGYELGCDIGFSHCVLNDDVYMADYAYLSRFLDGFFQSAGIFNVKENRIYFLTRSQSLLNGIDVLLTRIGVLSKRFTKDDLFGLKINKHSAKVFGSVVKMSHKSLDSQLVQIAHTSKNNVSKHECQYVSPDVYYDEIVAIVEVKPTRKYVYDFSVENTLNFATFSGVHVRDTFHLSGISNATVSAGLPRMKELINMTENPAKKSIVLYFRDEHTEVPVKLSSEKICSDFLYGHRGIHKRLVGTPFKEFCDRTEIIYKKEMESWYEDWVFLNEDGGISDNEEFWKGFWVLRIYLNKYKLFKHGLTPFAISQKISDHYHDMFAIPSVGDDYFIDVILHPNMNLDDETVSTHYLVLRDVVNPLQPSGDYMDKKQRHYLGKLVINGVDGISDLVPREETLDEHNFQKDLSEFKVWEKRQRYVNRKVDEGTVGYYTKSVDRVVSCQAFCRGFLARKRIFESDKKDDTAWVIDTVGSNMLEVIGLPFIDGRKSFSNNPHEVVSVLGIEAARALLVQEFKRVICSESYIYIGTISALADFMTNSGALAAVTRNGIDRYVAQVLAKASFEQNLPNLFHAAVYSESDNIKGVTATVHLGKRGNFGTGAISLFNMENAEEYFGGIRNTSPQRSPVRKTSPSSQSHHRTIHAKVTKPGQTGRKLPPLPPVRKGGKKVEVKKESKPETMAQTDIGMFFTRPAEMPFVVQEDRKPTLQELDDFFSQKPAVLEHGFLGEVQHVVQPKKRTLPPLKPRAKGASLASITMN
jgi:hypothetical protein